MRAAHFLTAALLMWPAMVQAQSSPNLSTGQVPTAGQWNGFFTSKTDVSGGSLANPTVTANAAGNIAVQVASNSALKSLTAGAYSVVYRAGYSAAGDGGAMVYRWSSSACGLNSGAGDNGSQVAPTTGTGCWLADFSAVQPTPMVWGAAGSGTTNDAAAVQAAVNALQGGTLYLGSHLYEVTTGVTSAGQVKIIGAGGGQGIYNTACTSGLRFGAANITLLTLNGAGSLVDHVCIDAASGVTNTSGAGIAIGAGANSVTVQASQINGACFGVDVSGQGTTQNVGTAVSNNTITTVNSASCAAVRVGANSTGANTVDAKFSKNQIYCNNASVGFLILDAGGAIFDGNTPYACSYGTKIYPGANQQVIWGYFNGTDVGDTSATDDLLIDTAASTALVDGLQFSGSWTSASSGGPSVLIQDSGVSGNVSGIHFAAHRAYLGSNTVGFDIKAGQNVTIDNSTICPSAASTGTGVLIEAAASETMVRNNRIGLCDHPTSGSLAMGVSVTQSSSNFVGIITGNDFANSTTPINYAPSGGSNTTAIIKDNEGLDNVTPAVASATTITLPVNPVVSITGTTTVSAMNGGWGNRSVTLIPAAAVPFTTGGNICNALTATASVPVLAVWNAASTCWNLK